MKLLQMTLGTVPEDLGLDQALLDARESGDFAQSENVFRTWEAAQYAVVVGRSCKVSEEVNVDFCKNNNIEIYRRPSGGGTVLIGPGCLMYSVVKSYQDDPELRMIDRAHHFVLTKIAAGISNFFPQVEICGLSDLSIDSKKFSGNALRCKRDHFLYHGTLLYDFDLDLIARTLQMPPREPDYRQQRLHKDFVMNLGVDRDELEQQIIAQWPCDKVLKDVPIELAKKLAIKVFGDNDWNFRR